MSRDQLKTLMKKHGLSAVDIASGTKLHPQTVDRYVETGRAHRSTVAAIERFIADYERSRLSGKAAAG